MRCSTASRTLRNRARPRLGEKTMIEHADAQQGPRKVLIADDDPAVVRLLATRCSKLGFHVDTATNGVQLLVKTRHNQPDVLIVDVNMPALDGLSVCARLLEPGRKQIEVIVITGVGDAETPERCESLGAFFARKGPDFWKDVESALTEIYPDIATRIAQLPAAAATPLRQRPRVLVVDDDPDINTFLASRLDKHGVDTLYASDATHGCRIAVKERPSAIIADYFMPDGDALFLLHRLRATPATADIPVIVITGRNVNESDQQTLKREICGWPGATHVLRKSFDTRELFQALEKFCSFTKPRTPDGDWREIAAGKPH
jgi:CheY-like chemotaxis protein